MNLRLLLTLSFILFGFSVSQAQEKEVFQPKVWLKNPTEKGKSFFHKLNNHHPIPSQESNFQSLGQHLSSTHQFFLVYKSKEEEYIAAFLDNERGIFIDSERLTWADSVNISGYNEHHGELLDMNFSSMKDGRIYLNTRLKDSYIYEAVLTSGLLDKEKANEIRTYLSLKYGINLLDHTQYQYKGKELWDGEEATFNHNIFGLAHFYYFGFSSQKSIHSRDKDLVISLPSGRKIYKDGEYVLIGNNNKSLNFDTKTNLSHKGWLLQTNSDELYLNLSFTLDKIDSGSFSEYELVVKTDAGTNSYKGKTHKTQVVFENIPFNGASSYFLNLKSTEPELKISHISKCEHILLSVKDTENIKHFEITAKNDKGAVILKSAQLKKGYIIQDKESLYYTIEVKYNDHKKIEKKIFSQKATLLGEGLKRNYVLDNGTVWVQKTPPNTNQKLTYHWLYDNEIIGRSNAVMLTKTGQYELVVRNEEGCEARETFSVSSSLIAEQWILYPNPASEQDEIVSSFSLVENANVEVVVYQVDGKKIKEVRLGRIQNGTYSLGMLPSGTYVVIAYIDHTPQIKKLIVK